MRARCLILIAIFLCRAPAGLCQDGTAADHLRQAREHWDDLNVGAAASEWRRVLEIEPDNATAREALARLATSFETTDQFLVVVEELIEQGFTDEAEQALARWQPPFASRDRQARVLVLRGRIALGRGNAPQALTAFASAAAASESEPLRRQAGLGRALSMLGHPHARAEGLALLSEIASDDSDPAVASEASWRLIEACSLPPAEREQVLREFTQRYPESPWTGAARRLLAQQLEEQRGRPDKDSLQERLAVWRSARTIADRARTGEEIMVATGRLEDPDVLEWLALELAALPADLQAPFPPSELSLAAWERMAATAPHERACKAARSMRFTARRLADDGPTDARRPRWRAKEARGLLMEGQLLLMENREAEAILVLSQAAQLYRDQLQDGDRAAGETLLRIGRILESRGRPDGAAQQYAVAARAFAGHEQGAEALWRLAALYRDRLDRPMKAVDTLKRYHDLYPPSFRVPTTAAARIRKLGYPDISSFQASHGLKVDGVLGSKSLDALRAEEENFREILPVAAVRKPVRGRMVHSAVFEIARDLEERGRFREAVHAFQAFLAMYPGHHLGDDALLSVARLFRTNDLFQEAAVAYARLMEDYPKGDGTSHAYLEAAHCHECLGDWEEVERLYDLFLKKFPRYQRAGEARRNLAAVRKLIRYADLVAEDDLPPARTADALYEMGRILYKEMGNRRKAVEVFKQVAQRFPATYHAPDAAFTAGVCLLHEENFGRARDCFRGLLRDHARSRLADDAQFWIGHTFETQARALGRLDYNLVILKRRSAAESEKLRADLTLRRLFRPDAQYEGPAWHEPHPDILEAGRTHDKVRADLQAAIREYRLVVSDHQLGDMAQKALLRVGAIYTDYLKDPDRAIETYRALLEKYPGSAEAVDAQFAVGRHYLEKGELVMAEKAITLFLTSFPNHGRASEALLDLAECHRRRKEWLKALDDYQSFLNRYPTVPQANNVREEIEWIKKYRF